MMLGSVYIVLVFSVYFLLVVMSLVVCTSAVDCIYIVSRKRYQHFICYNFYKTRAILMKFYISFLEFLSVTTRW